MIALCLHNRGKIERLAIGIEKRLPYETRSRRCGRHYKAHPHMTRLGQIATGEAADIQKLAALGGSAGKAPFHSAHKRSR